MPKAAPLTTEHEARNVLGEAAPDEAAFEALTIDTSPSATASPARHLQNTLGREFGAVETEADQWSARRTMAFVVCTCGAFWMALYFVIAAIVG